MFVIFAIIFYLGALFIHNNGVAVSDVFTSVYLIIFAGVAAGNNSNQMPDVAVAKIAARNLFRILDGEDEDQAQVRKGSKMITTPIKGHIQMKNVDFMYDSRQELALKNLNIEIQIGEKVGLVGPSGCGKSTLLQLLLGFYSPIKG